MMVYMNSQVIEVDPDGETVLKTHTSSELQRQRKCSR